MSTGNMWSVCLRGKAYRRYCTARNWNTEDSRPLPMKEPKYDGRCRSITEPMPNKSFARKIKMPAGRHDVLNDMIKGASYSRTTSRRHDHSPLCGTPTYNFVVVVDDYRYEDNTHHKGRRSRHNTPKQIHIYKCLWMGAAAVLVTCR